MITPSALSSSTSVKPTEAGDNIIFIDSRISDLERVVASLPAGMRWVIIDAERDGLTQIAQALQGLSNLRSIQVISHGGPGSLLLGSGSITASTLQSQSAMLASVGTALAPNGDLLLYGCDVAQGDEGAEFIALLARLTGTDVAASTDITGDTALGGDWVLEVSTGAIESRAVSLDGLIGTLATITGTAGNDSLVGGTNADVISGLDGNDTLIGDFGSDSLVGGSGHDSLDGGLGNDTLEGGEGNDILTDIQGNNLLDGGNGADTLTATSGVTSQHTLLGGNGNDYLSAAGQALYLDGGDGSDNLSASGQIASVPTVSLYAQRGSATLIGGAGDDSYGIGAFASIGGGLTASYLENASLDGGNGNDRLQIESTRNASLRGGSGQDFLSATNFLAGWDANSIGASRGTNYLLNGGADDDTISVTGYVYGDHGLINLVLEGEDGNDALTVAPYAAITSGFAAVSHAGLSGGAGNDALNASGVLQLTLSGGLGTDTFVLTSQQQKATQLSFVLGEW
jgi:Ca2+-binding RTX toxin-like protein